MFYGQMHAGEALSKNTEIQDYEDHLPRVKGLGMPNNRGARILKLQRTKTQRTYRVETNNLSADDPLFTYHDSRGGLQVMMKKVFLQSCNKIWHQHNVPRMTGHCFCIGGTTHYLPSGVAPDVVKALGRWRSDAFLCYWRNIEELARVHLPRTWGWGPRLGKETEVATASPLVFGGSLFRQRRAVGFLRVGLSGCRNSAPPRADSTLSAWDSHSASQIRNRSSSPIFGC
ncbi:hypothetical protein FB446DRAFT_793152 [Lentinula raphanica]|nr:hypothetical protein FB446DRAFT_793152 [Lentinula raphanica]